MRKQIGLTAFALSLTFATVAAAEDEKKDYMHPGAAQDFIHGAPEYPSEPWLLAAGGRIYDDWASALDREEIETTNPAYPVTVNADQTGYTTWRCKECHGWDYQGKDGIYSKGGHFTGIPGINGAIGKPVDQIAAMLRDANHPYTVEMINDEEMLRLAAFVSRGQVDMRTFLDYETRTVNKGDVNHGREIFQTTCAACHGFDGRLMDWGTDGNHNYVGTEAVEVPDEVMNKILNAHTGVQMINLRAFPIEYAIDVIAYAATLPLDPPQE